MATETKKPRGLVDELRGMSRLAVEATQGVTDLVQAMHTTILGGPEVLSRPLEGLARAVTGPVYDSIRGVTKLVGDGIDFALGQLATLVEGSPPGPEREAVLAAVNGVLGDYLAATHNPLAIEMRVRKDGVALELEREALRAAFPTATRKLLVLVHGSSMSDRGWTRKGHDHGAALARDLGFTRLALHYNSGLHVSTNGRAFAGLLDRLVAAWPEPVDELVLVTHSMGGLVARSACHVAEDEGHAWRAKLRALVFLGTPQHGAPLERGGNWIDVLLAGNRYSAPLARLGKIRSAGVTDLRYGNVLDEHWEGRDRFERGGDPRQALKLPHGVRCFAVAGTTSPQGAEALASDGLVPVDSALGRHERSELALAFAEANTFVAYGVGHVDLLSDERVYETLRTWLA